MPRLGELLKQGGWEASEIPTAASVIGAESTFKTTAKNTNATCGKRADGSPAYAVGLMQICTIHLDKGGLLEGLSEDDLLNPLTNVKAGKKIHKAQGWGAWEGFTNGNWRKFPGAQNRQVEAGKKGDGFFDDIWDFTAPGAVAELIGEGADVAGSVTDIPGAIANGIKAVSDPGTWFRLGKAWYGGVLIIIGVGALTFVVAKKAAGSDAGKAAMNVIPAGKAAKVLK